MDRLREIFPHSAGIDIGSEKVFVAIENYPVRNFRTFTSSYRELGSYLKEQLHYPCCYGGYSCLLDYIV